MDFVAIQVTEIFFIRVRGIDMHDPKAQMQALLSKLPANGAYVELISDSQCL